MRKTEGDVVLLTISFQRSKVRNSKLKAGACKYLLS